MKTAEDRQNNTYLALDSGGTKVAAVLYDGRFEPLATAFCGSLRANTTPAAQVEANFESMVRQLGLKDGQRIEVVAGTYEHAVGERLRKRFRVGMDSAGGYTGSDPFAAGLFGEMNMGLSAAGVFGDGMLALSGTGATVFARAGSKCLSGGGYGAAVADEGSGYWISREAMIAAIRGYEGRGEATLLTDVVLHHFGGPQFDRSRFREAVFSIYAGNRSPVARVAELVPEVVEAAAAGDNASARILTEAGDLLALQLLSLARMNGISEQVPVAISGSVWRKNPLFLTAFTTRLQKRYTEPAKAPSLIIPRFAPLMGVLMRQMYEENGALSEADYAFLEARYGQFRYEI